MSRIINEAAQAAKAIKQHLKANGIKASVKSSVFSMGDSVTVTIEQDLLPAAQKAVSAYCDQYQAGSFDGMIDLYEYNNSRNDIPQAKYVSVNFHFSDEIKQECWDHLRAHFECWKAGPITYREAGNFWFYNQNGQNAVYRVLNGSDDHCRFWITRKPRVKLAA